MSMKQGLLKCQSAYCKDTSSWKANTGVADDARVEFLNDLLELTWHSSVSSLSLSRLSYRIKVELNKIAMLATYF